MQICNRTANPKIEQMEKAAHEKKINHMKAKKAELAVFFFFLRPVLAASLRAAMAAARSYSSAWFSLFSSILLMPCSSSGMVGRLVAPTMEEESAELSAGGSEGEGGGSRVMGGKGA